MTTVLSIGASGRIMARWRLILTIVPVASRPSRTSPLALNTTRSPAENVGSGFRLVIAAPEPRAPQLDLVLDADAAHGRGLASKNGDFVLRHSERVVWADTQRSLGL